MGFFGRTLAGAAAGGIMGGMSDNGSALGGAIGGAAVAGFGGWGAKKLAGRFGLGSVSGGLSRGVGQLATWNNMLARTTRGGRLGNMMRGAGGFMAGPLSSAALGIGRNSVAVNKWGGRALMGLGVGSGALIGSSIISSNQGY